MTQLGVLWVGSGGGGGQLLLCRFGGRVVISIRVDCKLFFVHRSCRIELKESTFQSWTSRTLRMKTTKATVRTWLCTKARPGSPTPWTSLSRLRSLPRSSGATRRGTQSKAPRVCTRPGPEETARRERCPENTAHKKTARLSLEKTVLSQGRVVDTMPSPESQFTQAYPDPQK